MRAMLLAATIVLIFSKGAMAQMTPQQQQLPPSDPSSSQYHSVYLPSLGQGDTVSPAKWVDRWGAISDDGDGVFGIVSNMRDRGVAEENAVMECKKRGGKKCIVSFTYRSQCAAVAASESVSFSYGAPTIEEAKESAMQQCNSNSSNKDCWIYYSGCSLPERVQ